MSEEDVIQEGMFSGYPSDLPDALLKALVDPFDYALGLRDGTVIHFTEAQLMAKGTWIHLPGDSTGDNLRVIGADSTFPRGIDIRISDIMWVADAPDGS